MSSFFITVFFIIVCSLTGAGCRNTGPSVEVGVQASDLESSVIEREFPVREAPVGAPPVESLSITAPVPSEIDNVIGVRLRSGLTINVQVLVNGVKEVDEKSRRISEAGNITLPLVGNVPISNRTVLEAQKLLESLYGRFFIRPQIIIEAQIESGDASVSPWGYVTVLGRVKNPGRVNIPPTQDLTVSRAIQLAGGLSTSARGSSILVTRAHEEENTQMKVDLDRIGSHGKSENDLALMSGDVVFVPEKMF